MAFLLWTGVVDRHVVICRLVCVFMVVWSGLVEGTIMGGYEGAGFVANKRYMIAKTEECQFEASDALLVSDQPPSTF